MLPRVVGCAAFLALLAFLAGCRSEPPESAQGTSAASPVEEIASGQIPSFDFVDISGERISYDRLRGKVLLLDVWATWCQPCKEEMPWFQEFHEKYRDDGLAVIGISIDTLRPDIVRFLGEVGVTYPIVQRAAIMQEWGLLGLPATFIVDRGGRIRKEVIGFEYKEAFEAAIQDSLAAGK
jgi:thiol-disulfide isomerase/thioredoxin